MGEHEQQELVKLLKRALEAGTSNHDFALVGLVDRIEDNDVLAIAQSAQFGNVIVPLLQAMGEDRIRSMNNRELVRLAQYVERHWSIFSEDGKTPARAASQTMVEILLERLDNDVGLPMEARLQLAQPDDDFDVELIYASQLRSRYRVDSQDRFVPVGEAV